MCKKLRNIAIYRKSVRKCVKKCAKKCVKSIA